MHESSIAKKVLTILQEEMRSRAVTAPVNTVVLKVGRIHAIVPDSLSFHWDVLKKEHEQFSGAELKVEMVPLSVECPKCQITFELADPIFVCEGCLGPVTVKTGQEMFVDRIEIAD